MRCYFVLVIGNLRWLTAPEAIDGLERPLGFCCFRYVLAAGETEAADIAVDRVRRNFDRRFDWVRAGKGAIDFEAEEITPAPIYKLLRPDNRAHIFY